MVLVTHEPRVAAYADREVSCVTGRDLDRGDARMIRLGLRLTLGSGREAACGPRHRGRRRLGVGLLLAALAGGNGLNAQTDRGAWLDSAAQASRRPTSTSDGLWWLSSVDQFDNQGIDRVDVAPAGPRSGPAGIAHLPGPGEYYASPALTTPRSQPANELRDRFPGRQMGPSAQRRCRPRTR